MGKPRENANKPIAWANRVVGQSDTHHMMVSILPYDLTDTTGVASTKVIEIKARSVAW